MGVRRRTMSLMAVVPVFLASCGTGSANEGAAVTTIAAVESTATVSTVAQPSSSTDSVVVTASASTAPESTTSTTASTTSSTSTTTADLPPSGLTVVSDVDRDVVLTSVIVADSNGTLLGTALDPLEGGCEATPISYFVTVGTDGEVRATSTSGEDRQYAASVTPAPNQRQLLEVDGCEGFLNEVNLYDVTPGLELSNPVSINIGDAVSGNAVWNSDGFVTMMLSSTLGIVDSETEAEDGDDGPPPIEEYLVNPRNGERTLAGTAEEFHYRSARLADGRTVHVQFDEQSSVAVTSRSGDVELYAGSAFAISPDGSRMVVWDQFPERPDEAEVSLVNFDDGSTRQIANGSAFAVIWQDDGNRLAYSLGDQTLVLDLGSGDSLSVGEAVAEDCGPQDFVTWGRVPLAFAPNGDLYVGDPLCTDTEFGFPAVEYRVRQLQLS